MAISVIAGAPAWAKWPTSVRRSVTDPAGGSDDLGALQIELGLLDRRAGAEQLGVVVTAARRPTPAPGAGRPRRLLLTAGLDPGGLRVLEAAHRDGARVLLIELFLPARILLGHDAGWPRPPAGMPCAASTRGAEALTERRTDS